MSPHEQLVAAISREDFYGNDRLSSAFGPDAAESHESYCAVVRWHFLRYVNEHDPEARALIAQRLGEDLFMQALDWMEGQEP